MKYQYMWLGGSCTPSSVHPDRSQFPRANSLGFLTWDRERRDRFWGEGMSPRDQAEGTEHRMHDFYQFQDLFIISSVWLKTYWEAVLSKSHFIAHFHKMLQVLFIQDQVNGDVPSAWGLQQVTENFHVCKQIHHNCYHLARRKEVWGERNTRDCWNLMPKWIVL